MSHLQIFIDETGDVGNVDGIFTVGGIGAYFESEARARDFATKGGAEGREVDYTDSKGLRGKSRLFWGPTIHNPHPGSAGAWHRKEWPKSDLDIGLDEHAKAWQLQGLEEVFGFALASAGPPVWSDDLSNPGAADHLYRRLVGQALEVLLFEIARERARSLDVYVAARTRTRRSQDRWDADVKKTPPRLSYEERYGVIVKACRKGSRMIRGRFDSLQSDDVWPIVAGVTGLRGKTPFGPVRVARGASLYYKGGNGIPPGPGETHRLPPGLHFLADIVLRTVSGRQTPLKRPVIVEKWFKHGFEGTADSSFDAALDACRLASAGRWLECVRAVRNVEQVPSWAHERVREALSRMTGSDLVGLAKVLG